MNQKQRLQYLVTYLLKERGIDQPLPKCQNDLFQMYRALVNIREAKGIDSSFLQIQDEMLQQEIRERGIVDLSLSSHSCIVWKGDITRLKVDAIVNAGNQQLEGCFVPCHNCIDNAIHTYAGVQLRWDCHQIMKRQGYLEPVGKAKITKAYNLPCRYILHTVGPYIENDVTKKDEFLLSSCYESCLRLAEEYHLKSIAFCCISTGVFRFPHEKAAQIAMRTVQRYLKTSSIEKVIFNVFDERDYMIYHRLFNNK